MNNIPIKISNISKSFKGRKVLDNINFEVGNNEIFGFIGLNGIGKTTLIKIIIDLLTQDEGEVEIFGVNKIIPSSRKNIAYLPEKFYPSSYLKGGEFLKFISGFHKEQLNLEELEKIANNLSFDINVLSNKISSYSKGMVQKLGLLGSFLANTKLTILDEPMSGLDPKARIALKKQLIAYKEAGNSIFFSSHILSDIEEICDRVAVLNNGKISFIGTPQELKNKYQGKNLENAFLEEIGAIS